MTMNRWVLGALGAGLILFATACGSGDEGPGVATAGGAAPSPTVTASDESGDRLEQIRAFAQCMRDNGVDVPDPDPAAGMRGFGQLAETLSSDDPVVQAAFTACQSKLPNGGQPPKLNPEQLEAYRNFAACMRDNGIDLPDPAADGTLQLGELLRSGLNPDDPTFQAAFTACRDTLAGVLPSGAPRLGGGS
jgi:hypothetical protein